MLKTILIVIAIAIAGVIGLASLQPDTLVVERSIKIKAPAATVFPLVNDFNNWSIWSPWAHKDAAMKATISGAKSGLGAVYEWQGNQDVGEGRMEIVDMSPSSNVAIDLHFLKPFETNNKVNFIFVEDGAFTEVTWRMQGPMPFMSKLFAVFVSMDEMLGNDFETGLANLKSAAES